MNQILVNEKVYVTPKLKRKKLFYKILFVLSILIVMILILYYIHIGYTQRKNEAKSQEIISDFNDITIVDDDKIVVALSENSTEIPKEPPKILEEFNKIYTTENGTEYRIDSILNIPSIDIKYPVISECTNELLKISLNKFWGGEPNEIGNYCIVGHNYDGKDIFFGKLHKLQNGDIIELTDKTGKTLQYTVYNKFIVQPTDVACTSQLTNGKKEATLITCSDGGKTRLIVKCRVVE